MSNVIVSKDNVKIKLLNKLKRKKYRELYNQSLVEGFRAIEQLLNHQITPAMIFFDEKTLDISPDLKKLYQKYESMSIPVCSSLFGTFSDTVNSQGVLAIFDRPSFELQKILQKENARVLVLDQLQDPGNVGTIIRTADSAGFDAIFYTKGTVDIFSEKVNRSAMAANFYMPIFPIDVEQAKDFKRHHFKIFSTLLDDRAKPYSDVSYGEKFVLILGNEGNGISKEWIDFCDEKIYIPIYGRAESLNVAVAAGIVIYESLRHQNEKQK